MKIYVLHDEHGSIASITTPFPGAGKGVTVVPDAGQTVTELVLGEEHRETALLDLHSHYRVDVAARKLVKKKG